MRALILHGPGDLRLGDVPEPRPGPGEIVVAPLASLTCATDAKMVRTGSHPALGPLPAPLGHELAAVVSEVGAGVVGARPGDRVVVANSAPCGACPGCRAGRASLCRRRTYLTGAFAERVRVPAAIVARNLHALPDGVAPEHGAAAEPLACAVHTAAGVPAPAGPVLVLGGGVQGAFLTALLSRAGHEVHLADPHEDRRRRALRMGARAVHPVPADDPGLCALRAGIGDGDGAAAVVEAVGRPAAWRMALALVRPGGEVVLHGGCPAGTRVELPTGPIHYSELTLRGSYHHTPGSFTAAIAAIRDGEVPLGDLIGVPITLEQVAEVLMTSPGAKHPVMSSDLTSC